MNGLIEHPRSLGLACGSIAVLLGLSYMAVAGASPRYLLINLAALVLGATVWLALGKAANPGIVRAGRAIVALAIVLLFTALFGVSIEGASRWVGAGPLTIQMSLIVLPVMTVLFAREPDTTGTLGMTIAALALAIQPDRAMTGVLAVSLIGFAIARPNRLAIIAASVALLAFGWTLLVPDRLPAVPYVDGILYTAFDVHQLAGLAVLIGSLALVAPAAIALTATSARPVLIAFGACWAGVVAAAALGNYPTPLVGYGGSAILGYLLSVALLPNGARPSMTNDSTTLGRTTRRRSDRTTSELRIAS